MRVSCKCTHRYSSADLFRVARCERTRRLFHCLDESRQANMQRWLSFSDHLSPHIHLSRTTRETRPAITARTPHFARFPMTQRSGIWTHIERIGSILQMPFRPLFYRQGISWSIHHPTPLIHTQRDPGKSNRYILKLNNT
ncbi:hypothetical protein [Ktedonospora formicarum]|uniref:hypothetical protein n=1 Tax=Ktedonospora formicarum TaxID=2778364 RepID=UPI001C693D58|nr:hypothetical protein [Ktedonospora formicarum]